MATTTVAAGKVKVHKLNHRPVPSGWVVDGDGRPVTDAATAFAHVFEQPDGGITPLGGPRELGGHKGYGLAVMVHILGGTLAGASFSPLRNQTQKPSDPHNIGHFFLAIDPARVSRGRRVRGGSRPGDRRAAQRQARGSQPARCSSRATPRWPRAPSGCATACRSPTTSWTSSAPWPRARRCRSSWPDPRGERRVRRGGRRAPGGRQVVMVGVLLAPTSRVEAQGSLTVYCSVQLEWCQALVNEFTRQTGIKVSMTQKGLG